MSNCGTLTSPSLTSPCCFWVAYVRLCAVTALEMWWSCWIPLTFQSPWSGPTKDSTMTLHLPLLGRRFHFMLLHPKSTFMTLFSSLGSPLFFTPAPNLFISAEFQKITKMYPAVSYRSTMPIFLKDPSHRSYSLCFLFKYSECYWPF